MRAGLIAAAWLALVPLAPTAASAAVSVNIGINVPYYPRLVAVPGYPVYYAPDLAANYFYYDGLYWVFDGDNWYDSRWYNGPWTIVDPFYVPAYILRVPVRYYHRPPVYFRGWRADYAPRWHEHWGASWADRRHDWNGGNWDRHNVPRAAPLPTYQRNYSGDRYPNAEVQGRIHADNYRYQPREQVAREHYEQHVERAQDRREVRREERHDNRGHDHDRR